VKYLLYLIVLTVCLCVLDVPKAQAQVDWTQLPYSDGEEIIYTIYYNWKFVWVPAGEVRFRVTEKAEHLEFDVTGKSFSSYDSFFKVRDYYTSEVNKETLMPIRFTRDVLEGNYQRFDSLSFRHCDNLVEEYFGKTRETAKAFEFFISEVAHDMVSIIYHLRTYPIESFEKDDKIPVEIFFDKELFQLDVNFRGKVKKKIKGMGKQSAYHFQPDLVDGYVFSEGDVMDIWISDDGKRLPLLIESPIKYGSIKAVLTKVRL